MALQLPIQRKKILRKLGNTFSKRYNFKRLLQTAPDLAKLYNKQENAVNSITPIKFIHLKEKMDPIAACSPNDPASVKMFGPAEPTTWPRRIKYAEQIYDLNEHGFACVWTVRIVEERAYQPQALNSDDEWKVTNVTADVKQVPNPMVVTFWPDNLGNLIPPNEAHRMVNPEHLPQIDEKNKVSFFLSDQDPNNTPQELSQCGIIPHERHLWNATFYDFNVAHLYADSIEHQLQQSLRV